MTTLQWSDALALDLPLMDDTHREFVDLLAAVERADDATLVQAWQTLVDHTQAHFDREDRWMRDTRFSSTNCHSTQHRVVLQVLREGSAHAAQGDLVPIRHMAPELAAWFPQHAQSMDAALALHLRRAGYDPLTGVVHAPDALPDDVITGCGGACSTPEADNTALPEPAAEQTQPQAA
ncbi:MAG: hemerythrin [Burkholderiales bacterium]|nr:hemerythrin [Burkholderiales bacterium]